MSSVDFFRETYEIFQRWMRKTLRRPPFLFFALVQPIVWFVLFTQAFQRIADIPGFQSLTGTDNYVVFFVGAVLLQTSISSSMQSGMGMVSDLESVFLDKMRVAPIHRSAILVGKVASDGARILIQSSVIILLGLPLGVTFASGPLGLFLVLVIAAAFGIAWSGISNLIALASRNSEVTMMVSILTTFPLLFLSTAMMPMELLPGWIQVVATYNPMSYVASAFQQLIIRGFDFGVILAAFLVIIASGIITLSGASLMFRRTISG
jgi:ABC-2 type transport system permease protein